MRGQVPSPDNKAYRERNMKLVIIDDNGEVHTVIEKLEEYNLDKSIARANVIGEIQDSLVAITSPKVDRESNA